MSQDPSRGLTLVFEAIRRGEEDAGARLFALVYDELRRMAHGRMRGERAGGTLQTTALVHEAYLKLAGEDDPLEWENRQHFFGAAALAMRRILVDRARRRGAEKHGGGLKRVTFEEAAEDVGPSIELIALDEALAQLAKEQPRLADVVHYRYFLGMTVPETAQLLRVSARTIDTDWRMAKAWLLREMSRRPSTEGEHGEG